MNDFSLSLVADATLTATTASRAGDTKGDRVLSVEATWDVTTPSANTFPPGTLEVQTLTFPDEATAADGDYCVVEDIAGTKWAVAMSKQGAATKLLTFLAKASCVAGDFLLFYDAEGVQWGISVNKSGTDAEPTAKAWVDLAAAKKAHVDISADSTAASVAARFETAMNALTGFSAAFTTDDSANDGTMLVACDAPGPVAAGQPYKANAGTGLNTSAAGTSVVSAESVAGYLTAEPTGAVWSSIDADHKGSVDVTGLSTAIAIAAAAELVLDGLTGFIIVSDDSAGDGTMTLTQAEPGAVADPASYTFDDGTTGTVTGVETTGGVGGVNVTSNAVYHAAHGFATGLLGQLTTATTLPAGLSLSTDYYLIVVDANQYKFATSYANAVAGTAVNITGRGTGTHTFTPTALSASIKLQGSNNGTTFTDLANGEILTGNNSQTISADGSHIWLIPYAYWKFYRAYTTIAAGQLTLAAMGYSK